MTILWHCVLSSTLWNVVSSTLWNPLTFTWDDPLLPKHALCRRPVLLNSKLAAYRNAKTPGEKMASGSTYSLQRTPSQCCLCKCVHKCAAALLQSIHTSKYQLQASFSFLFWGPESYRIEYIMCSNWHCLLCKKVHSPILRMPTQKEAPLCSVEFTFRKVWKGWQPGCSYYTEA